MHNKSFFGQYISFPAVFFGLLFFIAFGFLACEKDPPNPNIPDIYLNVTIDPNSTIYQPLNTAGGWMYLTAEPPSRGIIVHRISLDEFAAFERMPPNNPNQCCRGDICTRLLVDEHYPFAKDTCTGTLFSLLDGHIFEGEGRYPMTRYQAEYFNGLLRIFN